MVRDGEPLDASRAPAVPSEDVMRHVFEAAPSAMMLVDAEGLIRMANRHCEQLFGYTRSELMGRAVEMLVPQRFRDAHPGLRSGFLNNPSVRAMGAGRDLYGLRRDGSEVPIEIGLNPLRTASAQYVLASIIDITQRKRGEDLLRASLEEKETLLREIHHRVKNNMQVISSLLSLQISNVDEPRYREMFVECQARVRAMALIHEKLYASGNLAAVDCGEYVTELAQMLVRSYAQGRNNIRLELATMPVMLDIQTAIPVGLILNELVTNSLKHAFPGEGGGVVAVELVHKEGGLCELHVRDDGCGLPEAVDSVRSRGLGLRMVRGLARQIDGVFTCQSGATEREPGPVAVSRSRPGTSFRVTFQPLNATLRVERRPELGRPELH